MKKNLYYPVAIALILSLLFAAAGLVTAQDVQDGKNSVYAPLVISGLSVKGVAACFNALANSSFETGTGWEIPLTAYSAGYSTAQAHTGTRSMRTGITAAGDNRYSYSDARQVVTIPADATSAVLRLWIYPTSTETSTFALPETYEGMSFGDSPLANDVQYVLVLDRHGTWIDTLLWQRSSAATWRELSFDLTRYRGQTIKIQFGTFNNGSGGITSMYVDDAYFELCSSSAPTPTGTAPTPTATQTPTATVSPPPAGCYEAVTNGGFETNSAWYLPLTHYPASYSTARAHSGAYSVRTGIVAAGDNRYSYSAATQTVTIPAGSTSAVLRFWAYQITGETPATLLEELPPIQEGQSLDELGSPEYGFLEEAAAGDVQYVLILDSANNWIGTLLWQRLNTQVWKEYVFDLRSFAGKTIKLHFGSYNDGASGVTSLFVDDVSLQLCSAAPTPTPTITPTATATSTPSAACYNSLPNSGFETSGDWLIPNTAYRAGYSTARFHSGARSMRTGITLAGDNRYSYSDAWQQVSIPANAASATLRLWAFQETGESRLTMLPTIAEGTQFGEEALAGDVQYVLILDRYGTWIDTLLWQRRTTTGWTEYVYNLNNYRGWTIRLQFGTYNDGAGGITSMYVDDVSLQICP